MARPAPLPDSVAMTVICKHGNFSLFDRGGKPEVLKRFVSEKRADKNAECLTEERGDLQGKHLTEKARAVLTKAWDEYTAWKKDMTL